MSKKRRSPHGRGAGSKSKRPGGQVDSTLRALIEASFNAPDESVRFVTMPSGREMVLLSDEMAMIQAAIAERVKLVGRDALFATLDSMVPGVPPTLRPRVHGGAH